MNIGLFVTNHSERTLCIILGLGLVGKAVARSMEGLFQPVHLDQPVDIDWNEPQTLCAAVNSAVARYSPTRLEMIWTAGKAGFSAAEEEMEREFSTFSYIIEQANKLPNIDLVVNFISSAGGIYENSRFVTDTDHISPSRPYAFGKLRQEKLLHSLNIKSRIYRVASVYGFLTGRVRRGMISNMIIQAKARLPVMIYANQNTLRDYVLSVDVGRYITEQILNDAEACLKILATGRSVSISILMNMVAKRTNLPTKATFVANNDNDKDIVFSKMVIPKDFRTTSLEEGIALVKTSLSH